MIIFLKLWCLIKQFVRLPLFIFWQVVDNFNAIKYQWSKRFEGWGLHIFTGRFGGGKTGTAVWLAYKQCKRYPQLNLLTNIDVRGFPPFTTITKLINVHQILDAPQNTLVLIDEIGTIFNSRDFQSGKAVPKILFQHLCQCRHRRMMIYATCQKWCFLDKALRDITDLVYECRVKYAHPFSRLNIVYAYYSEEYDKAITNPMLPLLPRKSVVFIQSNKKRQLYDTMEMVDGMLKMDYLSDDEIAKNRGDIQTFVAPVDKDTKKSYKKSCVR